MLTHSGMQQGNGGMQGQVGQQMRAGGAEGGAGQPVLYLLSLNGTFERKTIVVPFAPESLRIGRQTNQKTVPTPANGFFDSKVLSRQHAEVYAERNGKIFIRDVKSSNGTFVNGTRLSQENRESEPHELQTSDHLELGIDIVSEDQKTVVHHKVAAKVEHAGFLSASNNVLDMNFGDLDPANGTTMMNANGMQLRARNGNNAPMANNGRMAQNGQAMNQQANMMPQRPFFMAPIATDQIMKRLTAEMRNARLQAQDLGRTNQFLNVLLSQDDLKELDKQEAEEAQKAQQVANGSAVPLRPDTKARFSDPPAPPPQQPLPEKPDSPASKRGPTERPKSGPSASSPVRQDNTSQILQLTEALNNAKRDIDAQAAKNRELETLLQRERAARAQAEEKTRKLVERRKSRKAHFKRVNGFSEITSSTDEDSSPSSSDSDKPKKKEPPKPEETHGGYDEFLPMNADEARDAVIRKAAMETATFETRLHAMENHMADLKQEISTWKTRCTEAEAERDQGRKSLEEMVTQLREQERLRKESEEKARTAAREKEQATAQAREAAATATPVPVPVPVTVADAAPASEPSASKAPAGADKPQPADGPEDGPTLSRTNTITPHSVQRQVAGQNERVATALPYASILGVVLVGMGMMAYLNGWQAPPPPSDR